MSVALLRTEILDSELSCDELTLHGMLYGGCGVLHYNAMTGNFLEKLTFAPLDKFPTST